ncbi:MAG: sigma-70 family RNA polymerase sigma factor [Polyangiaceae bacterium]
MTAVESSQEQLARLFARLASGDRGALPETFRLLLPLVRRFCERLLGHGSDADDATQETLERIFERMGTYDASKQPLPWVFAIAAWEVKTLRRRAWRHRQRTAADASGSLVSAVRAPGPDPEAEVSVHEFLGAIEELIDTLPELERATLREALERELATETDLPTNATFRKRKERALQKLHALLRNLGHVQ